MDHQQNQYSSAQTSRSQLDLDRIAARIAAAPAPAQRLTRRAAVAALKPSLLAAIQAGHTPASLALLLKEDGLKVAARTLAEWLELSTKAAKKPRATRKAT